MELKELRSLAALSDLGSITAAAAHLHLSPAAIHKQLKVLEEELGVRLYEKMGRHLRLTEASEVLLPYLRELLAQFDSAMSAIQEWKGMGRGLVRIGAGPTISSYILPVLLKKFRTSFPNVELLVETGNTQVLLEALEKGALDLVLIISCDLIEREAFSIECSWDFELVFVTHMRKPPRNPHVTDLSGLRFILFCKGSRMEMPIDRYFAANGLAPNVVMRSDNAEAIKAMVRAGLGASMLPMWIVDSDLKQRRLTMIRQVEPPLRSKVALITRRSAYIPRAVRAFAEEARKLQWKNPRMSSAAAQNGKGMAAASSNH
jgi:DNA-binding transcriptional LysR family regulator